MSSRVDVLAPGCRFRVGGRDFEVLEVVGFGVRLRDGAAVGSTVPTAHILAM